jgi:carbonic anhydrase
LWPIGFERTGASKAATPTVFVEAEVSFEEFSDVLEGNRSHVADYHDQGLKPVAARGLAVLTCMDSRIDPLRMLGLQAGDAKILRNAGARVTDDVLRTLVLATYLLGVKRFMVVAHTNCRMTKVDEVEVHHAIRDAGGPDTRSLGFLTSLDVEEALRQDVQRVRSSPYLTGLIVGGFRYHLGTGELEPIC